MEKIDFLNRIYPSITGAVNKDWQDKLTELKKLKINKVAVFLSEFDKKERNHLYKFLLRSDIREVPLVHLRDDTDSGDIEFFVKNFNTRCFNIHENFFKFLDKWKGYWDKLYLEMNYDNTVNKDVEIGKIAGFCVDLSHLKSAITRGSKEAYYILAEEKAKIGCNHLNGFDPIQNEDKHKITAPLKDFAYLTSLPKHLFSEIIAIEVYNSIAEQLEFREYIAKLLNLYFEEQTI